MLQQPPDPCPDGDELIAEMDLYLSHPPLHRELYVLDYPSRFVTCPPIGSDRAVEHVHLRRAHRRLKLTLSLFPRDPATGGESEKSFEFDRVPGNERHSGDSQEFVSGPIAPPTANFAAGMYVPPESVEEGHGCVVLAPVQQVARMRPSFAYLDEVDAARQKDKALAKAVRDKEKGTLDAGGGAGDDGGGVDDGEEVEVEMTFTKRESDRAAERRKHSFAHLAKLEEEDRWVRLDFIDHTNPQVPASRDSIFRAFAAVDETADGNGDTGAVEQGDGARALAAAVKAEDAVVAAGSAMGSSGGGAWPADDSAPASYIDRLYAHAPSVNPMRDPSRRVGEIGGPFDSVRALSVERPEGAIVKVLASARVAHFSVLRECVRESVGDEELLAVVRKCAFLLRGCWVCNAPQRKMRRFVGPRTPARIPASRTLVLDMFRRSAVVSMATLYKVTFADVVPLDEESLADVLREVAQYETGLGWVFRLRRDTAFVDAHPDAVVEEEDAWEARVVEAREVMASGGRAAGARGGSAGGGRGAGVAPRGRGRGRRGR
jgi:hypothetical protein